MKRWIVVLFLCSVAAAQTLAGNAKIAGPMKALKVTSANVVIARDGNCTAATTSCTFSATATGDLKIIFASRSNSTSPPSLPGGGAWTTISSGATSSGGVPHSYRIGCNVSSSSGDTGSGTWTNASDVVGLSYSGTAVGTTANCNITGVGATSFNNAKASTTINYAALTMQDTSGGSWVAGFAGTNLADSGAPSGMTNVTTAGSGPAASASDTNATATAWPSTNVTQASGTWMTAVLEILVQQGFTLIQNPTATGCSGTTCAVTLTQTLTAGNLLVAVGEFAQNNVLMTSIDKGGTLVSCTSCAGGDIINGSHPKGYILSISCAGSCTSPATVTLSATTTSNIAIYELRPNAGVTASFDGGNALTYPSGVTPVAPNFTPSGTKAVRIDTAATANNVTAATLPYALQSQFVTGNAWTSWEKPPTSGPTWTLSGAGQTSLGDIIFSNGATAGVNEGFQGFEGGSNGTSVTEALLRAGNFGWQGGQWGFTGTAMTFQTAASCNLLNSRTRMYGDGTQALNTGSTLGVRYVTSAGANSYITNTFETNGTGSFGLPIDNVSISICYQSDVPDNNTDGVIDFFSVVGRAGADFATAQNLTNAGSTKRCLHVESSLGQDTACIDINTATVYRLSLEYNKSGNAVLKVYDSSGTLIGTSTKAMAGTTQPSKFALGNLSATVPTTGFHYDFDGLVMSLSGGTITP